MADEMKAYEVSFRALLQDAVVKAWVAADMPGGVSAEEARTMLYAGSGPDPATALKAFLDRKPSV